MNATAAIAETRYPAPVWSRFCDPRWSGAPRGSKLLCAQAENIAYGLCVTLHVLDDGAGARQVRFTARGCPTTIALADAVAEALENAGSVDVATLATKLEIGSHLHHCVMVCEDAVNQLLRILSHPSDPTVFEQD